MLNKPQAKLTQTHTKAHQNLVTKTNNKGEKVLKSEGEKLNKGRK